MSDDIVYKELQDHEEQLAGDFLHTNDDGFAYLALLGMDQDHVFTLGAFHQDKIIGLFQASCVEEDADIITIAVSTAYRRKGVAKELWDKFLELKPQIETVILEVSVKNIQAVLFYEKIGFTEHGLRHSYYKDLKTGEITDASVMVYNRLDDLVGEIVF